MPFLASKAKVYALVMHCCLFVSVESSEDGTLDKLDMIREVRDSGVQVLQRRWSVCIAGYKLNHDAASWIAPGSSHVSSLDLCFYLTRFNSCYIGELGTAAMKTYARSNM